MKRSTAGIALAMLLSAAAFRPASAQLGWTVYGVGEFDTEDVIYGLVGLNLAPSRLGIVPDFKVQAFVVRFPVGVGAIEGDQRIIGVTPSIGVANNFTGGTVGARVGYTFADADDNLGGFSPNVTVDVGEGVVTTGQLEYWGTGALGAQALATYNFDSEALWARGRLTHRIFGLGDAGHVRAGGEVAFLNVGDFSTVQPGVLIGIQPGAGTIINLGAGLKLGDADATYFKAELVLFGTR